MDPKGVHGSRIKILSFNDLVSSTFLGFLFLRLLPRWHQVLPSALPLLHTLSMTSALTFVIGTMTLISVEKPFGIVE